MFSVGYRVCAVGYRACDVGKGRDLSGMESVSVRRRYLYAKRVFWIRTRVRWGGGRRSRLVGRILSIWA